MARRAREKLRDRRLKERPRCCIHNRIAARLGREEREGRQEAGTVGPRLWWRLGMGGWRDFIGGNGDGIGSGRAIDREICAGGWGGGPPAAPAA